MCSWIAKQINLFWHWSFASISSKKCCIRNKKLRTFVVCKMQELQYCRREKIYSKNIFSVKITVTSKVKNGPKLGRMQDPDWPFYGSRSGKNIWICCLKHVFFSQTKKIYGHKAQSSVQRLVPVTPTRKNEQKISHFCISYRVYWEYCHYKIIYSHKQRINGQNIVL